MDTAVYGVIWLITATTALMICLGMRLPSEYPDIPVGLADEKDLSDRLRALQNKALPNWLAAFVLLLVSATCAFEYLTEENSPLFDPKYRWIVWLAVVATAGLLWISSRHRMGLKEIHEDIRTWHEGRQMVARAEERVRKETLAPVYDISTGQKRPAKEYLN